MGLFVYTQKGSIISIVDLPTTEIIEPEFSRLAEVFPEEHIYYAHPYSTWERGTNENHNRLIRRWLPKGTKKTTLKEVAFIENWMNNYPKKCLDYKSPSEFLMGG